MYQGFLIQPAVNQWLYERASHFVPRTSFKKFLKLTELEKLILGDDPIDAEQVSNLLFPKGNPDVFLSHSYADQDEAIKIAEQMRELGVSVFIDSEVWGSVYDLLQKVDDAYCLNSSSKIYSYQKRNRSTAHIYMILSSALHHMIDRSEAFIFVASENSLVANATVTQITDLDIAKTASPWIYSELLFSSMVRRQMPERIHKKMARTTLQAIDEARELVVHHSAPLKHLTKIEDAVLKSWLNPALLRGVKHPLDALYKKVGVNHG